MPDGPVRRWILGLAPLVLLGLLLAGFFRFGPAGVLRKAFPPVEELTIERIALPVAGRLEVSVVNGGPEAVTVAQVFVDDAAWSHEVDGGREIPRLGRRTIRIPYPWVEGEPLVVKFRLFGIVSETKEERLYHELPKYEKRIRDAVISLVQKTESEQLAEPGLKWLKAELVAAINRVVQDRALSGIAFSDFSLEGI